MVCVLTVRTVLVAVLPVGGLPQTTIVSLGFFVVSVCGIPKTGEFISMSAPIVSLCHPEDGCPTPPPETADGGMAYSLLHNPVVMRSTGRSRSSAVRYTSKAAADTHAILVKANRTPIADEISAQSLGLQCVAVGIQGWRKAMEDRHFIAVRGGEVVRHMPLSAASHAATPMGGSTTTDVVGGNSDSSPDSSPRETVGSSRIAASATNGNGSANSAASPTGAGSPLIGSPGGSTTSAGVPTPITVASSFTGTTLVDAFIGVYDGHQNANTSAFAAARLHELILEPLVKKKILETEPTTASTKASEESFVAQVTEIAHAAFQRLDDEHRRDLTVVHGGSTAVCALVTRHHIVMCNLGDSKVAIIRDNGSVLTFEHDHRPDNNEAEVQRVLQAGGTVTRNRVNGMLSVTRAFGDFALKPVEKPVNMHPVIAIPEVIVALRTPQDRFVVAGCDGVWELNSLARIEELLRSRSGVDPLDLDDVVAVVNSCCNNAPPLVDGAGLSLGCDNITLAVLEFCRKPEADAD